MRSLSKRVKRWQAFLLVWTISLGAPEFARADDKEKILSDLISRAEDAVDADKIPEAISLWMQAWKIQENWDLPCNIGRGYYDLKKPDKCATYLTRCTKLAPLPTTEQGERNRRREREMLQSSLDHVASVVVSAPQGARVIVDGEERGTAPLSEEVFLMPGEHRFIAELDGRSVSRNVTMKRKEKHTIDLAFPQPSAAPTQSKPIQPQPLQTKPVELKPIQFTRDLPIASNYDPLRWAKRWGPSIALLGSSAALVGAGVWFQIEADKYANKEWDIVDARNKILASSNDAACVNLSYQYNEARADYRRMNNASMFTFGAAGVLGIAGLVYPWLPIHGKSTSIAVSKSGVLIRGDF